MSATIANAKARRTARDRRGGIDRRSARAQVEARLPAGQPIDLRHHERRDGDRRADTGTLSVPPLVCPFCKDGLEYEAGLSWIAPDTYAVDTGYCATCSRRFFRTRETGHYDALSWPPLCRVCREPIGYVSGTGREESVTYRCSSHPSQEWEYRPLTEQWIPRAQKDLAR
jgi:hypothetical protein